MSHYEDEAVELLHNKEVRSSVKGAFSAVKNVVTAPNSLKKELKKLKYNDPTKLEFINATQS